jgi:hypothetical protein
MSRLGDYGTGIEVAYHDGIEPHRLVDGTEHGHAPAIAANTEKTAVITDRNGTKTEHSARKCFQQRRLCGIPFMILLVGLLAFILGGALGGGLGGAIAVGRFQ